MKNVKWFINKSIILNTIIAAFSCILIDYIISKLIAWNEPNIKSFIIYIILAYIVEIARKYHKIKV